MNKDILRIYLGVVVAIYSMTDQIVHENISNVYFFC